MTEQNGFLRITFDVEGNKGILLVVYRDLDIQNTVHGADLKMFDRLRDKRVNLIHEIPVRGQIGVCSQDVYDRGSGGRVLRHRYSVTSKRR